MEGSLVAPMPSQQLRNPSRAPGPPAPTSAPLRDPQTAARAPAHVPTSSSCATRIVDSDTDGWLLTELQDEVVLFRPYTSDEVQDAANTVMALWSGRWAIPERRYLHPCSVTTCGQEGLVA